MPAAASHDSPSAKYVLLLGEDDKARAAVEEIIAAAGFQVTSARDAKPSGGQLEPHRFDAVVATLDWPPDQNASRVRRLKRRTGDVPLVILAPPERVDQAIRALRHGAEDYLLQPPDPYELRARLVRALERQDLDSRIAYFQDELSKKETLKTLEARSPAMRTALSRVLRVAPMRSTVLIGGESGVGKELVARAIHFNSPRRSASFIALNCAAMPPNLIESDLFGHEKGSFTGALNRVRGKFEIAHQGTLFLDEIGEMDPTTQAKLLRVLEDRSFMRVGGNQNIRVDVRLIAATNADLDNLVAEGRFRRDLYYRLKVVSIQVPPLRDRREDIPNLVYTFLEELSRENAVVRKRITPEAMSALQGHAWPGNVRELKNLLESILVSTPGEVIRAEEFPFAARPAVDRSSAIEILPGMTLSEMERALILRTLEHTGGNRTHSAELLGIGVRTLQRKIRSYDIDIQPKRRRPRATNANRG